MTTSSLKMPPLAVYVHLPWCLAKCPYCDFNSYVTPAALPEDSYVDRLLEDLDFDLPDVAGRTVRSVFFGGGTPSLFAPESIGRFLSGLRRRLLVAADAEVTLEANPGTLERGRFAGYRTAGITRISLGVQSFDDARLKQLGRIHDSGQARAAVRELQAAGFDNFNLDLMYGLPGQNVADACDDVARAIELAPAHISHYQLSLEPGTVFHYRPPMLPTDEATWEMQERCQRLLAAHGYEQYEVSAYSRAGLQCRHNLNYWQFGDYLGLGAGAHGKITDTSAARVRRTVRRKQPREYLATATAAARVTERRDIERRDLPFEFALNALRLKAGLSIALFCGRTGLSEDVLTRRLEDARSRQLVEQCSEDVWRATALGERFLNDLQALFLPD